MHQAYGFPVTIMRAFNTYGRKDNQHFLVERIITQMLNSEEVRLGDPAPVISWMYVADHVDGYLTVLDNPEKVIGERFNLSYPKGVSVEGVARKCADLIGYDGDIIWNTIPERPIQVKWLVGDPSKIQNRLGWKAKFDLETGLQKTIDIWRDRCG